MGEKYHPKKYLKSFFIYTFFYCIIFIALAFFANQSMALEKNPPFSHYEVIEKRNMFKPLNSTSESNEQDNFSFTDESSSSTEVSQYALTGIIAIFGRYKATITDQTDKRGYYVGEGDKIDDFLVKAVSKDSVILEKNSREFKLKLRPAAKAKKESSKPASPNKSSRKSKNELIDVNTNYRTGIIQSIRKGIPNVQR